MIYKILPAVLFLVMSLGTSDAKLTNQNTANTVATVVVPTFEEEAQSVYASLSAGSFALPQLASFTQALRGYYSLKEKGLIKKDILTLVDFSLSANTKRLWVIDMSTRKVLYNSLVAHGRNTGNEYATKFSNAAESYKSSLGFYATGEVYFGKHGKSLRLDGLEKGINSNARNRAVVIHGANYVSESFIRNNSRLGRSLGCPALPVELTDEIINTIKDKSLLFIYHPSRDVKKSPVLVS